MKHILTAIFAILAAFTASSQNYNRDSIQKLTNQDYQYLLEMLEIEAVRPGPSGDPSAENAANTNEAKVDSTYELPKLMQFENGENVNDLEDWKQRRTELFRLFDDHIYGRTPENLPAVSWQVISEKDSVIAGIPVKIKELLGTVDNSAYPEISVNIPCTLTIPAQEKPVPVVVKFDWIWARNMGLDTENPWNVQLLENKIGYASLVPTAYQADNGAGLTTGIIGLVNKGERRSTYDWGALKAWAWGASRVLDYFEKEPAVDAEKVAIEGVSRYGKAALVTMAYDERFSVGFIGSSGAGGAKILRRNFGEQLENLASSGEYQWFTPNFVTYISKKNVQNLPVDAHELIALVAPRPLFFGAGNPNVEGGWVDATGMYEGVLLANPAYELFGKNGVEVKEYPVASETFYARGDLSFRQHEGGHTSIPNWPYFIEFVEKYWKP